MAILLEHNSPGPGQLASTHSPTGTTGNLNSIFTVPRGIEPPEISDPKKPGCNCECHTPGTLTKILSWPYPLSMKCSECTCRGL